MCADNLPSFLLKYHYTACYQLVVLQTSQSLIGAETSWSCRLTVENSIFHIYVVLLNISQNSNNKKLLTTSQLGCPPSHQSGCVSPADSTKLSHHNPTTQSTDVLAHSFTREGTARMDFISIHVLGRHSHQEGKNACVAVVHHPLVFQIQGARPFNSSHSNVTRSCSPAHVSNKKGLATLFNRMVSRVLQSSVSPKCHPKSLDGSRSTLLFDQKLTSIRTLLVSL